MRIKIDKTMRLEVDFPEEMTALEFLGFLERCRKIISKSSIDFAFNEEKKERKYKKFDWSEEKIYELKQMMKNKSKDKTQRDILHAFAKKYDLGVSNVNNRWYMKINKERGKNE